MSTAGTSWSERVDPSSGATYYENDDTGETSWEPPPPSPPAPRHLSAYSEGGGEDKEEEVAEEEEEDYGDWVEAKDGEGRVYFFNQRTNETAWTVPQQQRGSRSQTEFVRRSASSSSLSSNASSTSARRRPPPIPAIAEDGGAGGDDGEDVPETYHRYTDEATGHYYYVCVETGESSWQQPPANALVMQQPSSPVPVSREDAQQRAEAKLGPGAPAAPAHARSMSWAPEPSAAALALPPKPQRRAPAAPRVAVAAPAAASRSMNRPLAANFHRLPEPLKDDIKQFQLKGYAQDHFRTMKRRRGLSLVRRVVPVDDAIQWQREPIGGSLLRHAKNMDKASKSAFKTVQQLMGDAPTRRGAGLLSKQLAELGAGTPEMRDEIYCQLAKQVTKNPSSESTAAGWKALCVCAAAFAPSRGFQDFLLAFLAGAFDSEVPDVQRLAPYCYWRVNRTVSRKPGAVDAVGATLGAVERLLESGVPSAMVSFGGSLDYIVQLQASEGGGGEAAGVPRVLTVLAEAVRRLGGGEVHGMFRIAAERRATEELRAAFEEGRVEVPDGTPPHVVGDLLKVWLRELSPPLFPHGLYADCLAAAGDLEASLRICRERLSPAHLAAANFLLGWLRDFAAEHGAVTEMGADNLAIVFSPNLLRSRDDDPAAAMRNAQREKNFLKTLIGGWPEDGVEKGGG